MKIFGVQGRSAIARRQQKRSIGYAVVGLGHIAQVAVLPAFANARNNSRLVALVSGEKKKLSRLARQYGVSATYSYDDFEACLANEEVDAVYIALPNNLHAEFTERAARAAVHVLCEKPMAVTEAECERMMRACRENGVRLMIAYRLHFEEANLGAIRIAQSGKLGDLKFFDSLFSYQVKKGNIRTRAELGGGPIYDIGIYCINAVRGLFRSEPEEVFAWGTKSSDPRFREIEEAASAVMRFPDERLASFTCSFGAGTTVTYRLVGTKGDLCLDNAYEYRGKIEQWLRVGDHTRHRQFGKKDQFAPELIYFSNCILRGVDPEPGGEEGLADVRVIRALHRSIGTGQPVKIHATFAPEYPQPS
ncbi:MAG TPA: Gfo/Idh/MocA family oxidoreductase, partial [Myxococcaceae bacterium]|nr:Gfo/Idh/MocA family oxidoreductase [Myxococcaceae bacterium]